MFNSRDILNNVNSIICIYEQVKLNCILITNNLLIKVRSHT